MSRFIFPCSSYARNTFLWKTNSLHPFSSSLPISYDLHCPPKCQQICFSFSHRPPPRQRLNRYFNSETSWEEWSEKFMTPLSLQQQCQFQLSPKTPRLCQLVPNQPKHPNCAKAADHCRVVLKYVACDIFHADPYTQAGFLGKENIIRRQTKDLSQGLGRIDMTKP